MKKRIILMALLGLFLGIGGCSSAETKTAKVDETNTTKKEEVKIEEKEVEKEEVEVKPVEEKASTAMSQDEFITETFATYGYAVPDKSSWIMKQEGDNKVAVIIKEYVGRGRPNISKLIFLWNGTSEDARVLFVMVNNQNVYQGN